MADKKKAEAVDGFMLETPGGDAPWWGNGDEYQAAIFPTRAEALRFRKRHAVLHAKIIRVEIRCVTS
jgi:hypothetical protein